LAPGPRAAGGWPGGAAPGDGDREEADRQIVSFARGGSLNLVGAVCNGAALFGVTMLLARRLGRVDVGVYAQAYAVLALLGSVSLAGLTTGLTRFVAVHLAERDQGAVRGTIRFGLTVTIMAAGLLSAALFFAIPWLVEAAFHEPRLAMPLRLVALTLPATAFTDAALAATQGYRTMKPFALIGLVFEPLARLGLMALLLLLGAGLPGVMAALLCSNLSAAVMAALALRRVMGPATAPATYRPRPLLAFATMSGLAGFVSNGLIWADTLLLGLLGNSSQVGVYNVATRLVQLATFVMLPINAAFSPRIADLYHRGRLDRLRHAYALAGGWIVRLSVPAFVLLVVFPRDLLALFGRGFAAGAAVTVILAAGKFIDAATGPCGLVLNMTGRPKLNLLNNLAGLVLNILLNIVLIPRFGIVGSAVAWAISLAVINGARLVQVWLSLHMLPFEAAAGKGLVAGVAAFIAALTVREALGRPAQLLVGAGVIAIVYLVALRLQGLSAEDRLVLSALLSRRRVPDWDATSPAAATTEGVGFVRRTTLGTPLPSRAPDRGRGERPRFRPERPPRPPRRRPPGSPVRYLRAVWRRRLLVLTALLTGLAVGVAVLPALLPAQPTYRATVRLDLRPFAVDLVSNRSPAPTGAELAGQALDLEVMTQLVSRLDRLPRQLDATRDLPPQQWPTGLLEALDAEPVPGTYASVTLSLVDRSGRRARQVLEPYARRLTAKRNATDQARTRQAVAMLDQQARELRLNMMEWSQRVDQERAASPIGSASTLTQAQFDAFLDSYRAKLADRERLRRQVAQRGPPTAVQLPADVALAGKPLGRTRTLTLGALAGLLAGLLLALLLETIRPRLITEADTASAAGVDVLTTVPRRRRPWLRPGRTQRSGAEDRAYQRLAFSLERQGLGKEFSVVAVASAELGEGKSTIAVGLARALTHRGRTVVVVSGDLRRPVVERILGVPDVPGLGDYLEHSGTDVASLLVAVRDNLLLLPAGWVGRGPASLLTRPHLAEAVARLRDLQLVVLVDTPAAGWWPEALVLAAEADATLLVARFGRSRWKSLAELAMALHRDRIPVLGVVLVGGRRPPKRVLPDVGDRTPAAGPPRPGTAAGTRPNGLGNGHGGPGSGSHPVRPRPPGGAPPDPS
jgi:O-antigen/teichoic acid export membrane protein/Mrp family chromosome partitioning ATPase